MPDGGLDIPVMLIIKTCEKFSKKWKKKVNELYGEPEKIKKCSNDMFEVFEDDLIPIKNIEFDVDADVSLESEERKHIQ